jgi:D-apionolactonase
VAASQLASFGPVGVGTLADFYQLNQSRPPIDRADFVCWSMNPQVHAFDNLSLFETPEAIPSQIESARSYFPGRALVVSPVTLKPRFNPVATGPETVRHPGEIPPGVDSRQCSLVGAAWTLAVIKSLAESGADSVTVFETVGWRGVIERSGGPPVTTFASVPGGPFPLYYALRWVNELPNARLIQSNTSDPRAIAVLGLSSERMIRILVANLTDRDQMVIWPAPKHATQNRNRSLDLKTARMAMSDCEEFLRLESPLKEIDSDAVRLHDDVVAIHLTPYELACIDFEE